MAIAEIYPLLHRYLPDKPTILEAGAHIGRDTQKMALQWPNGIIHAFEPVPSLFKQLQENSKHLGNVHRYPYALATHNGEQTIYISSGRSTATSSLLEPVHALHPTTKFEPCVIPTITLDTWAKNHCIQQIDFLWLDMQGGELDALKAGLSILKTVQAIYTEISLEARYKNNPLHPELKAWLELHGFTEIYQKLIKPTWGNALFVKQHD